MAMLLDTPVAVRRVAMDLLARREHSRVELERKLRLRGATAELIEPALDRLAEQGLLSDTRFLQCFVASRARGGHGPVRIREELAQRGLPREAIEQALREVDVDWAEQLLEVWQRKFAGQLPLDARERAKQGRFLAYRGYPLDLISRLLRGIAD
jgi:regulatory protein